MQSEPIFKMPGRINSKAKMEELSPHQGRMTNKKS